MNIYVVVGICVNLFEAICSVTLFNTLFPRRNFLRNQVISTVTEIAIISSIGTIIGSTIERIEIKGLIFIAVSVLVLLLFHKSSWIMNIGVAILLYAVFLVLDYSILVIAMNLMNRSVAEIVVTEELFLFLAVLAKTILFLIIMLVRILLRKKTSVEYISNKHWMIFVTQALISILAISSIIELVKDRQAVPMMIVVVTLILLFSNVIVFKLLELVGKEGRSIREHALIKQQMEIQLDSIHSLSMAYNTQRKFMHDYQNEIGTIFHLLENDKGEKALDFVKEINTNLHEGIYKIKTNHDVVDAVLNQKEQKAETHNILFDVRASDLSKLSLPNDILVTVLGNAIDNAIEACENIPAEKKITIKVAVENNQLIFSVINPVNSKIKIIDNKSIATTKKDRTSHGIGLKNIALAMEKCDGEFDLFSDEKFFQFTAMIRL